ncbi:MAG: ribosomal protein S18-alanine N-acetyltransferase [Elusimicrobiales bacterium]|nr:ribosomal protein S18-alanine N-acetyltransferase [Elusimicrobiales bacterium]
MIVIRKAVIDDIESLASIESEWSSSYPCWGRNGFLNEFKKRNSYTFVVEIYNKICAFINFWIIGNEIEINSLVVSKKFIKNGIGSLLLNKVFEIAKDLKVKRILLEVRENNNDAINLYRKNGFEIYNIRKKYYDFKYDAIMMERYL